MTRWLLKCWILSKFMPRVYQVNACMKYINHHHHHHHHRPYYTRQIPNNLMNAVRYVPFYGYIQCLNCLHSKHTHTHIHSASQPQPHYMKYAIQHHVSQLKLLCWHDGWSEEKKSIFLWWHSLTFLLRKPLRRTNSHQIVLQPPFKLFVINMYCMMYRRLYNYECSSIIDRKKVWGKLKINPQICRHVPLLSFQHKTTKKHQPNIVVEWYELWIRYIWNSSSVWQQQQQFTMPSEQCLWLQS